MAEQLRFIAQNLPNLIIGFPGQRPGGLLLSLVLAIAAVSVGFVIANLVGAGYNSRRRPLHWICRLYVELFRGIPLLLLLLIVYQIAGNPRYGLDLSPRAAAVVALALYSGAYQAEIIRAGLSAVPDVLVESARNLGSGGWHTYRTVKLRYALRTMLPAFTGQAISLFKDTSVVVIIGVAELMTTARVVLGADVTNTPYWVGLYLTVGLLYFALAFLFRVWLIVGNDRMKVETLCILWRTSSCQP